MARARNIKPKFFTNEILGEIDPLICLLFINLWMLADREGRLEDRPKRILGETFPHRREITDINGYLTVLVQHGFIDRYKVGDLAVIQIVNFRKHQSPHNTEKPSELPAKPVDSPITVKESLPDEKVVEAKRADSLIPDSPNPDSLIPDSVSDEDKSSSSSSQVETCDSLPPKEVIPYKKILTLYHEILPMCPRMSVLTKTRKGYIAARWTSGAVPDLETWRDFFIFVGKSKFLTGQVDPTPGKKRFIADLEWMTRESNFIKIYEKKYHGEA
jgi:hypothetical protein